MKNTRAFVMIAVAFVLALGAVLLASQWVKKQPVLSTRQVAVAAAEIEIGTRLTRDMVRVVAWPVASLPQGSSPTVEKLVDRVTRTGIQRDEPLLEAKLAPIGTKGGLSAIVAEGKRAITVRVNDVVGVAGFTLPGNYVDILVNTQDESSGTGNSRNASVSKIVLEHILVLAVAQEAGRDETKPKVVNAVTLEVTPHEAEKIDLARSVGTLSLILRNQVDPNGVVTDGVTKTTLLGQMALQAAPVPVAARLRTADRRRVKPPPGVVPPEPPGHCVRVVTGTQISDECF